MTPFTKSGSIDYSSLKCLVQRQVEVGNGILLLGSTGESLALTTDEKRSLLECVSEQKLPVPVLVGLPGFQLEKALDWLRFCETFPVDGYLIVTPIYARPGPFGQLKWFRTLLDNASKPCMLYNIPSRAGVALDPQVLAELSGHPNVWALKEASGSLTQFQSYRDTSPELALFSGNDHLMPALARMGSVGLVSVMGNVWPEATRLYVELSLQKKEERAVKELLPAIQCVNRANPVSTKILLHELGQLQASTVRSPLSQRDGSLQDELLQRHVEVEKWRQRVKAVTI